MEEDLSLLVKIISYKILIKSELIEEEKLLNKGCSLFLFLK